MSKKKNTKKKKASPKKQTSSEKKASKLAQASMKDSLKAAYAAAKIVDTVDNVGCSCHGAEIAIGAPCCIKAKGAKIFTIHICLGNNKYFNTKIPCEPPKG